MCLKIKLVYDVIANDVFSDISTFKLVEDYAPSIASKMLRETNLKTTILSCY